MAKHCPTCNRSSDEVRFIGEFCEKCMSDRLRERLPGEIEVERCRVCGKIRTRDGFAPEDRLSLGSVVQQRLNKFKVKMISHEDGKALLDVVSARREGDVYTEKEVEIKYRKVTCDSCYKRIGGYYEATVQLRGDPERISRMIERITRYAEERGEFVAKVERADNGYDMYVSSKALVSAFISEREITAKVSYTLSGLNQSGKKVYKNTYAIRL